MKTSLGSAVAVVLLSAITAGNATAQRVWQYNPNYQSRGSESKTVDGVTSGSSHNSGLATRTESSIGISQEREFGKNSERFAGVNGSVQSGHFTDSKVYQKGKIGDVSVENYASGSTFVGTEVGGKAGVGEKGATLGAGAFSGGRAVGKVGTDLGAVGYGAKGEVWSGVGAEAAVNAGIKDGKLKLGGELGGGLGVGGKVGVEVSVDVRPIENAAKDVGRTVDRTAKDIQKGANQAAKDLERTAETTSKNIDRTANKVVKDVDRTSKNVVKDVDRTAKKVAKDADKTLKSIGKLFK